MCKSVQVLDCCDSLWKIADKNNVFLLGKSLKNYHGLVLSNVSCDENEPAPIHQFEFQGGTL
jgi:hypothetical protein